MFPHLMHSPQTDIYGQKGQNSSHVYRALFTHAENVLFLLFSPLSAPRMYFQEFKKLSHI